MCVKSMLLVLLNTHTHTHTHAGYFVVLYDFLITLLSSYTHIHRTHRERESSNNTKKLYRIPTRIISAPKWSVSLSKLANKKWDHIVE